MTTITRLLTSTPAKALMFTFMVVFWFKVFDYLWLLWIA